MTGVQTCALPIFFTDVATIVSWAKIAEEASSNANEVRFFMVITLFYKVIYFKSVKLLIEFN